MASRQKRRRPDYSDHDHTVNRCKRARNGNYIYILDTIHAKTRNMEDVMLESSRKGDSQIIIIRNMFTDNLLREIYHMANKCGGVTYEYSRDHPKGKELKIDKNVDNGYLRKVFTSNSFHKTNMMNMFDHIFYVAQGFFEPDIFGDRDTTDPSGLICLKFTDNKDYIGPAAQTDKKTNFNILINIGRSAKFRYTVPGRKQTYVAEINNGDVIIFDGSRIRYQFVMDTESKFPGWMNTKKSECTIARLSLEYRLYDAPKLVIKN